MVLVTHAVGREEVTPSLLDSSPASSPDWPMLPHLTHSLPFSPSLPAA